MEWQAASAQISNAMNLHLCNIVLKSFGRQFRSIYIQEDVVESEYGFDSSKADRGNFTVSRDSVKVFLKVNRCPCNPVLLCN